VYTMRLGVVSSIAMSVVIGWVRGSERHWLGGVGGKQYAAAIISVGRGSGRGEGLVQGRGEARN